MNKIIISRTDKIGDLVLSLSSFYMLRRMYPEAYIIVLVRNYNFPIVEHLECVNDVWCVDEFSESEMSQKLETYQPDAFIALYTDRTVAKWARASKAKYRIGPWSKLSSFFSYNKGVFQKRSRSIKNEAEYNLDLVRSLNKKLFDDIFEVNTTISIPTENSNFAKQYVKENNWQHPLVICHPFTGGSAKNITLEQYITILDRWCVDHPKATFVVTGAQNDRNGLRKFSEALSHHPNFNIFCSEKTLLDFAALINQCDVFVGASTGPTHIAGALKKKIIGIYPSKATQAPKRWGVYANNQVIYIIPDAGTKEDYSLKYFTSYNQDTEREIIYALKHFI